MLAGRSSLRKCALTLIELLLCSCMALGLLLVLSRLLILVSHQAWLGDAYVEELESCRRASFWLGHTRVKALVVILVSLSCTAEFGVQAIQLS